MEDHEILQSLLLEEEVRPFVYGVVTIHIKGAVDLRPHINGSRLGLRFHVRNLLKKTRGASVTNEVCAAEFWHEPVWATNGFSCQCCSRANGTK